MVPVQEKSVGVIVAGVLDDAARAAYARAFGHKCDTTGGLGSLDAALAGASLFDVVAGGAVVARYALKLMQRANGIEMFVVAAVGAMPGADLVASIGPHIELQGAASGAACVTVNTRRRGLVKKLAAQGWRIDSYVLRKKIQ